MSAQRNQLVHFLFLICGAHSAVYNGRLQHAVEMKVLQPQSAKSFSQHAPSVAEPPEFIARGFLEQRRSGQTEAVQNAPQHSKRPTSGKDIVAITGKCRKSCGNVIESGCVPECQVKTFACLDYDRTSKAGTEAYKGCERTSLSTYETYSKDWESTHPMSSSLVARNAHRLNGAVFESLQDQCMHACGEGVDTSCVVECQVKLYQCLDFDKATADGLKKYEACEKEVIDKYESFAADWDATHPYLMAMKRHVSAKQLQLVHDQCASACEQKSGTCIPRCEVSSYACFGALDENVFSDKTFETCTAKVTTQTSTGDAGLKLTAGQFKDIETACRSNCGLGADRSCSPECQVQMYACSGEQTNPNGTSDYVDYVACSRSVLARYEKFSFAWNAAHPYLLSARGHDDPSDLDDLHESCEEACGPNVDATCVPECHVKVYACLDHKHFNETKVYKKCTRDVLASYEHFADDWDASHPYLQALRKHVSEAMLLRVLDKCEAACGKGVDSSCVPECQVEMYSCLDHDQKTRDGAKLYNDCEAKVIAEYEKFGATWDSVHPY